MKESDSISDCLRAAIAESELTMYEVAKRSGVSPIMIGRFLRRERDIRLATADKIARTLECRLSH